MWIFALKRMCNLLVLSYFQLICSHTIAVISECCVSPHVYSFQLYHFVLKTYKFLFYIRKCVHFAISCRFCMISDNLHRKSSNIKCDPSAPFMTIDLASGTKIRISFILDLRDRIISICGLFVIHGGNAVASWL